MRPRVRSEMQAQVTPNSPDFLCLAFAALEFVHPRPFGMMDAMAIIHISEAEAVRSFAGLMAQVRAGAEVEIADGARTVAVLHMPIPTRRSIAECISLLPEDSSATIDEDFARDVQEAHREPLDASAWG
jgi:antitoxin (DNA-binding transcriptional repressor) of toxin-antitoxin stability system